MTDQQDLWHPARLPGDFRYVKTRVVGDNFVVQGESSVLPSRLFVRQRGEDSFQLVTLAEVEGVRDFDYLPVAGGVFVLTATKSGIGWSQARISILHLATKTLERIYSADDWRSSNDAFPIELLGCSDDGRRLAVACGELIPGSDPPALRYRLGLIDPVSRTLERKEALLGLFF